MRSLFEISDDLHFLEDFLTDTGGEITDEAMEAEIDKWLANLGEERDTKIDNYCALHRELEARALARSSEAARMRNLADIDTKASARLKARLFNFFDIHGMDRVDTARFRVTRVSNGGALPLILDENLDAEKLPNQFRKVIYEPNRTAICDALAPVEVARLRKEKATQSWNDLEANMLRVKAALENRPVEDFPEAVSDLELELKGYEEALPAIQEEFEQAYDEHRALAEAIPFARLGTRGKHLRIK